jgi:uncharacterized membrane protein
MRIDTYTKTVLTLIASLLGAIALRPGLQPITASAQSALGGVQFTATSSSFNAFDAKSGDVWLYSYEGGAYSAKYLGRITQLGQPMSDTLRTPGAPVPR